MLPNKAVKIFVEPDEEIVFIVEKILEAATNRVILIIPNTAALISSAVSLKVLARQILKTDKLIILVSDTTLAKTLGSKASLMVCSRVSDVSKEAWLQAKELKDKMSEGMERIKKELLSARLEPQDPLRVEDFLKKVLPQKSDTKDQAVGLETAPAIALNKTKSVKAVILEDPPAPKVVIKTRLKERVIDINGIKLVAGGDIRNNKDLMGLERGRLNRVLELNPETEDNHEQKEEDQMERDSGYVGYDMTKELGDANNRYPGRTAMLNNQKTKKNPFKGVTDFFTKLFSYVSFGKIAIGLVAAFVVFFGASYFFLTSAKVEIEQTAAALTVKKTISAKIDEKDVFDVANLAISAQSITKDANTTSEALATGEGFGGEYAVGELLVYNSGATDVQIKEGQMFTYNYNAQPLKFRALESVLVPAAAPKTATLRVKADSYGETYNVETTFKNFLVEGYPGLSAQNVSSIVGGTTVTTKVVSKEDIEDLKLTMAEKLKTQLLTALKSTLGSDDMIFDGTEVFTEDSFKTVPVEGTPIEKFSADLKMTVKAVIIKKSKVKELLVEVAKAENGYSRVEVKEPVIENIKVVDKLATFDARVNAVGMTELDVNAVTAEIKGKSVTEAKEIIKAKTGVSNVIVRFNPPYIPISIQKIPEDTTKFSVIIITKEN